MKKSLLRKIYYLLGDKKFCVWIDAIESIHNLFYIQGTSEEFPNI